MATGAVSANRLEILQIANAVAAEKSIDKRIVLEAMEEAIQKAARSRYGLEHDIRAEINPDSGDTKLWRVQTVVETIENPVTQLTLAEAKKMDSDAEIGNEFREELPPFEFGRVADQPRDRRGAAPRGAGAPKRNYAAGLATNNDVVALCGMKHSFANSSWNAMSAAVTHASRMTIVSGTRWAMLRSSWTMPYINGRWLQVWSSWLR